MRAVPVRAGRHERWRPGNYVVTVVGEPDVWWRYDIDGWQRTTGEVILRLWHDPSFCCVWYQGDPLPPPQPQADTAFSDRGDEIARLIDKLGRAEAVCRFVDQDGEFLYGHPELMRLLDAWRDEPLPPKKDDPDGSLSVHPTLQGF